MILLIVIMTLQYNKDRRLSLGPSQPSLHHHPHLRASQDPPPQIPLLHPKHWSSHPHHSRYTDEELKEMLDDINAERCEKHKNYIYDPDERQFVYQDLEDLKRYQDALKKFDEINTVIEKKRLSQHSVRSMTITGRVEDTRLQKIKNYFKGRFKCFSSSSATEKTEQLQNQAQTQEIQEDDVYCCQSFGRCCIACWCCLFTCLTCGATRYSGLVRTDSDMYPRSVLKLPTN